MKLTFKTIIQNYFHRFHAEVSMAAFSLTNPGRQSQLTPEFYRFWLIQDGRGTLHINGSSMELEPGQLLLLPPGAHQSVASDADRISLYWCNFRASIGDMELFDLLKLPICVVPDEWDRVTALFRQLIEAYRSCLLTRELRIRAAMFEILALYLDYGGICEASLREVEPLEKIGHVLEYIEEHLSETIAIEELARLAFLHPNYFIGYFKNIVGYAPAHYVNIRRLERAKQLLEQQQISISDIARQVGMQNHYLSRLFRQHTGLTPSRYRQIYNLAAQGAATNEAEGTDNA